MASSEPLSESPVSNVTSGRSEAEIKEYWESVVIEEPVTDDLRALVRENLVKRCHFQREHNFRDNLTINWLSAFDRCVLKDGICLVSSTVLRDICNKPTAFYWLQSAPEIGNDRMLRQAFMIIFMAFYDEWHKCYDSRPNIEYEHFFVNPVRITKSGPKTVRGVIDTQLSLCAEASSLINQGGGRADYVIEHRWYGEQHSSLLPLYPAIIMIIDNLDSLQEDLVVDGVVSLSLLAQRQTVLIARTGVEDGLSAPVSFASLRSQSLPLQRPDTLAEDIDVIRVSLATAVKFIVDLEMREDLANPNPNNEISWDSDLQRFLPQYTEDYEPCMSAEAWTDAVMADAEEHGYERVNETWVAMRRIKAESVREEFWGLNHLPWPRFRR